MGTLARGCARSTFPGGIIFGMTSFILIFFPLRIFLEQATAPIFSSRLSHFCLLAREALFHRRFFSAKYCHVDTRARFIPQHIVRFLVSKIVCSSCIAVSPLMTPDPVPHPCPLLSSPSKLCPRNLLSPSNVRTPSLESSYREFLRKFT